MSLISSKSVPVSVVLLSAALALPAVSQNSQAPATPPQANTSTSSPSADTSATGQPLAAKSNEGFWGKLNPMARKKWVKRQTGPIKDRLNELDQLTAKNSSDIKDVDARAQAGIHQAQSTAEQANTQASQAGTQASQAQQTAQQASAQTAQLGTTISNLDQYQQIAETDLHFRSTQVALNEKAKAALDQVAQQLAGQKGYIVEVQGYSRAHGQAGIQRSQNMADAVVRYLVIDHQVPVYRIYRVAMGNVPSQGATSAAGATGATGSGVSGTIVQVTLMHNSLAGLNTPNNGSSTTGATQQ